MEVQSKYTVVTMRRSFKTHYKETLGYIFDINSNNLTLENVENLFKDAVNDTISADVIVGNCNTAIVTAFEKTLPAYSIAAEHKMALECKDSYIINNWTINQDRYDFNDSLLIDKNTIFEQGFFVCGYNELHFATAHKSVHDIIPHWKHPADVEEKTESLKIVQKFQNGLSNRGGTNVSKFLKFHNGNPVFDSEILFCKTCVHYFSKHCVNVTRKLRCPYCQTLSVLPHIPVAWFHPNTLNVNYDDNYTYVDLVNEVNSIKME